jgi:hypothetical protein
VQRNFFHNKIASCKLNPCYVTGFVDGEGCFYVSISKDSKFKTNFRIKSSFQIGIHVRDTELLEKIKLFFGVGNISKLGSEAVQYRVTTIQDLKVIINHFENFPLLTYKQCDYMLFKQAVKIIEQKKHLTLDGLKEIVSIKKSLNTKQLSNQLKYYFEHSIPATTPKFTYRELKDLN